MIELINARFMNTGKTLMEIEIKRSKTDKPKRLVLNVPNNFEKGKDIYFDKVIEKFDIDQLSAEFDKREETEIKKRSPRNVN